MKNKVLAVLLGIFLVLAGLELFLRAWGFCYNRVHKEPEDAGAGYRIYCVGESTTWGIGSSDPVTKGYPRRLEEMLNEKYPGANVRCFFNQAIGQNTSEILAKFPRYMAKYRPDLVVFLAGVNNRWNMDRSNVLLFSKNAAVSEASLKLLIFLDKFRTWKLFKNLALSSGLFRERWDFFYPKDGKLRKELDRKKNEPGGVFEELAEYDIGEMLKLCRAKKVRAIMCTYPMDTIGMRPVQQELARKFGVPLVDHYEVFQKLKDRDAYLWPEDHWHPNDAGYALMANNVYNCIVENDWVPVSEKRGTR